MGSAAFAAPDLPALSAPVIWREDRTRHILKATSSVPQRPSRGLLNLTNLSIACHLHFGPAALQVLIVHGTAFQIAIQIDGAHIALGATDLTFHSHGWGDLDQHAIAFDVLAHIVTSRRLGTAPDRPGAAETQWIRKALMAFDGDRAGASQREIAGFVYGAEAEANTWGDRDAWLRSAVRRDIRRGHRLVESDWRRMVAGGSRVDTA